MNMSWCLARWYSGGMCRLAIVGACGVILGLLPPSGVWAGLAFAPRQEVTHAGSGHAVHLSGATVAAAPDGRVLIAWSAAHGAENHVYVARLGETPEPAVRVNPDGLLAESLHQAPGLSLGPGGEIYVSWSSARPKPAGVLFASDLQLSRSLDGGQHFDAPLRINEDRPISHSFEGLAVAPDGTVMVAWIDTRDGGERAGTYLARVGERGSQVAQMLQLDRDTCVCCRVHLTTAPPATVAVIWRKVFPGNARDMVLGLSRDGGRTVAPAVLIHADGWRIAACPHRGGNVGIDGQGRIYTAWYTEGAQEQPSVLFAASDDGQRFSPPMRLDTSAASIPDHLRLAVNALGHIAVVWEDATAVRRRVLLRLSHNGGRTWGPIQSLSPAIKAYAPEIAVTPAGGFVAVWHEEQFPHTKTVVQTFRLEPAP